MKLTSAADKEMWCIFEQDSTAMKTYILPLLLLAMTIGGYTTSAQSYCYPSFSGGCTGGDSITKITLGSTVLTSGCATNGIDTSHLATNGIDVYRGQEYSLVIENADLAHYAILVDYNQDGDFTDPGEYLGVEYIGTISTFTTALQVPRFSKLGTTRLRIVTADVASTTNINTSCESFGVGGEMHDIKLNIKSYKNDIMIDAVNKPNNGLCESDSFQPAITLTNLSTTDLTNVPVTLKIGTSTFTGTVPNLKGSSLLKYTFPNKIIRSAAQYNLVAYSSLSADSNKTNDTFKNTIFIRSSNAPEVMHDTILCKNDASVSISAKANIAKDPTYWYDDNMLNNLVHTGDQFSVDLDDTVATYYAVRLNSGVRSHTTSTKVEKRNNGIYLDITAKVDFELDSFTMIYNGAMQDIVEIYYREGSYVGYVSDSSSWIYHGTSPVYGSGVNTLARVPLSKKLQFEAGKTYGIFLFLQSTGQNIVYGIGNLTTQNADLKVTSGFTTATRFGAGTQSPSRHFSGTLYYTIETCPTAVDSVRVEVRPQLDTLSFNPGSFFFATYDQGTLSKPDAICTGDSAIYGLKGTSRFNMSNYGSEWTITSVKVQTAAGTPMKRFAFKPFTKSTQGSIALYPSMGEHDSTYIITVQTEMSKTNCSNTFQRHIRVRLKPESNFTISGQCSNNDFTTVFTGTSSPNHKYTWRWGDNTSDTGIGVKGTTHRYNFGGQYKVTLELDAEGCKDTFSRIINVVQSPRNIAFNLGRKFNGQYNNGTSASPDVICADGDTTFYSFAPPAPFTNASYGTSWLLTDIEVRNASNIIYSDTAVNLPNGSSAGELGVMFKSSDIGKTFTVSATYFTLPGFCDSTISRVIKVLGIPKAGFTATSACIGNAVQFTDASTSTGSYSSQWDFGDGSTTGQRNPQYTYKSAGNFIVKLKITNASGCSSLFTDTVTISDEPVAAFSIANLCSGSALAFTSTSTKVSTGATYSWSFGDGATATGQSPTHTYAKGGSYVVSLTVTNPGGCFNTTTKTVQVKQAPGSNFVFETDSNKCSRRTSYFRHTETLTSPEADYTFSWNMGDGTMLSSRNATHIYTVAGTYSVALMITDKEGCSSTTTKSIKIENSPMGIISAPQTRCVEQPATMSLGTGDPTQIASVVWKMGDGALRVGNSINYSYKAGGTYKVIAEMTTLQGCKDTTSRTITIFAAPVAQLNLTSTVACQGDPVRPTSSTTGSTALGWDFGDGFTTTDVAPSHAYTKAGSYTITLVAQNANGCADTATRNVVINPAANTSFTSDIDGQKVSFQSTASNESFVWYFGDGDSATGPQAEHTYDVRPGTDTTFTVTLTAISRQGCKGSTTQQITVTGVGVAELPSFMSEMKVYPNPFRNSTTLSFTLTNGETLTAELIDAAGRTIPLASQQQYPTGTHQLRIDAGDLNLSNGIYTLQLRSAHGGAYRRIIKLQ